MELDYLISGAQVFDGDGVEPLQVDVGIMGSQIAYVGPPLGSSASKSTIAAENLYLCPGFIDTHASTGLGYRHPHAGDHKLFQGITTELIGNCGTSTAPIGDLLVPTMEKLAEEIGFTFDWRSLDEWFGLVDSYGLPFNVGTFVGHSTLRAGLCPDIHHVSEDDIDRMCDSLEQAMVHGALGLSTGLVYAPGSFADTSEIIRLARVSARNGGVYVSHIRDERQDLEASVEEAIEIGRQAGLPVLISHLKAAERPNWGKLPGIIDRIQEARREGVRVNFEVYPYAAASTKLRAFIPKDTLRDGVAGMTELLRTDEGRRRSANWLIGRGTDFGAMVLITDSPPGRPGKSIGDIAEALGSDPADVAIDILLSDPDAWIVHHSMSDLDVDAAVLCEHAIICSDSWSYPVNAPNQIGQPHPRTYGAFTRFLERYVLRSGRISFGEAVRKITSYPADFINLKGRGRIAKGAAADLVLLDPNRVREHATYTSPRQFSDGTEYLWVNGRLTIEQGELLDVKGGQILKNQFHHKQ